MGNIDEFYDNSSDWIIMRELFGQNGFSTKMHQFASLIFILLAANIGYHYLKKENSVINSYALIGLTVIALITELAKMCSSN
jgi:hypothetical protein